jgi:hypothetical protein
MVSVVGCCSAAAIADALLAADGELPPPVAEDDPVAAGAELVLELEHAASAVARARPPARPAAAAIRLRRRGACCMRMPFLPVISLLFEKS